MKIVVASLGRAHLLDCARELQKQGHDVIFFSITPSWRFNKYGLNKAGWNKYYYINIEFDNQIICKKKVHDKII